jgi:hypothetical protein
MPQPSDNEYYAHDTLNWSKSFEKWFGYPRSTRDTTNKGANDGTGQAYTIHQITLATTVALTDTLTLVIGRYTNGSNTSSGAVNVSLPSGSWYLLSDAGTWSAASSPVSIRNGEWKVLSKNTSLSDNGPGADVTAPNIIGSPSFINITTTTCDASWDTDDASDSYVHWGTVHLSYPNTAFDASKSGSHHSVHLTGLPVNSTIYVQLQSTNADGLTGTFAEYTFMTATGGSYTGNGPKFKVKRFAN